MNILYILLSEMLYNGSMSTS